MLSTDRAPVRSGGRSVARPRQRGSIAPPMKLGLTLDVRTRAAWRAWLLRNHARTKEIWLVYHAKAGGGSSIPYNDAVDEAICFGWIDSTVKKVGAHSRAQRFTPRRKGSPISEMNKARARRLVREGRRAGARRARPGSGPGGGALCLPAGRPPRAACGPGRVGGVRKPAGALKPDPPRLHRGSSQPPCDLHDPPAPLRADDRAGQA